MMNAECGKMNRGAAVEWTATGEVAVSAAAENATQPVENPTNRKPASVRGRRRLARRKIAMK
jgi:hypothetical protein